MNNETTGALGLELVENMPQITMDRIGEVTISNAKKNLQHASQGKSLKDLRNADIGRRDTALVIAAGPSIRRRNAADVLKSHSYDGAVIVTDSALAFSLRNGIVPDLVVTLDPHAKRIVRWFGDPNLNEDRLKEDDYFSRQDLDKMFANQIRANEEILELLGKYGKQIKIALSSSSSELVVKRALETGMEIYWWNPMLDDPDRPDGLTRILYKLNGFPSVNAGGNVGTACWMMAHAVLGKRHIALMGMDFSYYDDTPYKNTQYYYEAVDLVGEDQLDQLYIRVFNPYIKEWFYTDPAYMWYRNAFLELVADADCVTYNCTEGGILFGENIVFVPPMEFFNRRVGVLTV